jgi:hypothetical protein
VDGVIVELLLEGAVAVDDEEPEPEPEPPLAALAIAAPPPMTAPASDKDIRATPSLHRIDFHLLSDVPERNPVNCALLGASRDGRSRYV